MPARLDMNRRQVERRRRRSARADGPAICQVGPNSYSLQGSDLRLLRRLGTPPTVSACRSRPEMIIGAPCPTPGRPSWRGRSMVRTKS